MTTSANLDTERFRSEAHKYAAYLETPEGRLRLDLAFANLQEFLPSPQDPLRVLDVGCGTGALAIRLAQLGSHVTLLDSSPAMLEIANRAAHHAGVAEKIAVREADASQLTAIFSACSFDVVLCHNTLEFVHDPQTVLRACASFMRDSSSLFSVLVRNRAGEVLKAAILAGDLAAAETNLTSDWGQESLYGGSTRLFAPAGLRAMLQSALLETISERGVRIVSDYLPSNVNRSAEYDRIRELENKLGNQPEFAAIARYTHCLARRASI